MTNSTTARLIAGIPAANNALFHRIRFSAGDPAAWMELPDGSTALMIRDIEAARAKQAACTDRVVVPSEFAPAGGLSSDRETATAQAVATFLCAAGVSLVQADRSTPHIFIHQLREAGLEVQYDETLGTADRRAKDAAELEALREAQSATEVVMQDICALILNANVGNDGVLQHDGEVLTSERVQVMIDLALLEAGYENPGSIVASGPAGADCHFRGAGPIRTSEPVIIDIYPRSKRSRYNGDCTRTVVNGTVSDELHRMHEAVCAAKKAAIEVVAPGVTGEAVHQAAIDVIQQHGFEVGLAGEDAPASRCAMVHGTGHGVGLDVHEPPLLDFKGPELVLGDVITVEPGLYCVTIGGIRVEDMVAVTAQGSENFNHLPEGLNGR